MSLRSRIFLAVSRVLSPWGGSAGHRRHGQQGSAPRRPAAEAGVLDVAPGPAGLAMEPGLPREVSREQLQRLAARRGSQNETPRVPAPATPATQTPPAQQTRGCSSVAAIRAANATACAAGAAAAAARQCGSPAGARAASAANRGSRNPARAARRGSAERASAGSAASQWALTAGAASAARRGSRIPARAARRRSWIRASAARQ